jgi:hypothetical protein
LVGHEPSLEDGKVRAVAAAADLGKGRSTHEVTSDVRKGED